MPSIWLAGILNKPAFVTCRVREETIRTIRITRRMAAAGPRAGMAWLLVSIVLSGCTALNAWNADLSPASPAAACPVTEPAWLKPPDDPAVSGSPEPGHYFANQDRSMWASAWWTGQKETYLRAGEEGIKVGWFRPAGAALEITGQRLDAPAPPLEAHVPCCYPTRFQATGLVFPGAGCWRVTARAADRELSFVVRVEP